MFTNRSELDIWNLALALIGVEPLTTQTLTSNSPKEARMCKAIYPQVRDECMDLPIVWNFMIARTSEMSYESTTPESGYSYMYLLPDNCIKVISVVASDNDNEQFEWRIETWYDSPMKRNRPVLLCDEDSIYIKYLRRVENPGEWPAWFAKVVYHRMAQLLCIPMSKDDQRYNQLGRWYKDAYMDAKAANGMYKADVDSDAVRLEEGSDSVVNASDVDVPTKKYIETRS